MGSITWDALPVQIKTGIGQFETCEPDSTSASSRSILTHTVIGTVIDFPGLFGWIGSLGVGNFRGRPFGAIGVHNGSYCQPEQ
jgi:hypothetical protein